MPTYQALLIGNGEKLPARMLQHWAHQADYVLAVDGGADKALACGVVPDGVIGDLDSVSAAAQKKLAGKIWHVPTQNNTDLEKALLWCKQHHKTSVLLVGFVGDRWDFSFGNMLTIGAYALQLTLTLAGDGWQLVPVVCRASFACTPGKRVSIIPLSDCRGVTLRGLVYPLVGAALKRGTTRSLSNQTAGKQFSVSVERGTLLVYQEL